MFLGMPPYRYPYNAGDALNRAIGASHCFSEELQDIVIPTQAYLKEQVRLGRVMRVNCCRAKLQRGSNFARGGRVVTMTGKCSDRRQ